MTITAQLASQIATQTIPLAPDRVNVDRITLNRGAASLDVQLSGYDNTRSASVLNFIFYDLAGKQLGAPVSVTATAGFQQYFNAANLGGMFALDAVFPVTGNTATIDSVQVEIVNTAGIAQTPRTKF